MTERFGIYFAPSATGDLWRRAAIWLGRDALSGHTLDADIAGIDPGHRHRLTRSARRYGFHATLKAPMALADRLEGKDLDRALKAWSAEQAPLDYGRLVLGTLGGGFLALVPEVQSPELTAFAGKLVGDFDGFRAPPSEAERARRLQADFTPRQVELLGQFGYPYVMEEFRIHMTLTDSLAGDDLAAFRAAATQWFAPDLGTDLLLDRLVLFHEAEPGAPFTRLRDYPLTGGA